MALVLNHQNHFFHFLRNMEEYKDFVTVESIGSSEHKVASEVIQLANQQQKPVLLCLYQNGLIRNFRILPKSQMKDITEVFNSHRATDQNPIAGMKCLYNMQENEGYISVDTLTATRGVPEVVQEAIKLAALKKMPVHFAHTEIYLIAKSDSSVKEIDFFFRRKFGNPIYIYKNDPCSFCNGVRGSSAFD